MPVAKRCRKGIVGIEAAIVLIAFVIIAAALAYVVVNTGFFASQKSKDTIMRGISEAASSLQLDGSVIAYVNGTNNEAVVTALIVPLKISVGREGVDVSSNSANEYDKVKIEIKTPIGASLIIEREIPLGLQPNQFIDLG